MPVKVLYCKCIRGGLHLNKSKAYFPMLTFDIVVERCFAVDTVSGLTGFSEVPLVSTH